MNTTYILIGVVALVILFIIVWVKMSIDEKKGENSEEKQKVKDIVKKVVPNGESYTAAYGTRETLALGGGCRTITTTTSYWYYAVAFKPGDLYLVPLSFDGGDISYGEPIHYGKNDLGMAEAFGQFARSLMQEVNAANGITDIKAAKKEARKK